MSVGEFFAMGGYAFFVWGAYGVTALVMTIEVLLVVRRKRTLWRRLGRITRMAIKVKNEAQT
jgi:heme exporter protein D